MGSWQNLRLEQVPAASLSWDGTLGDPKWAREVIEQALARGWKVQIAYVQRPIAPALQGALERGVSEGRMVPLLQLPAVHAQVQSSIVALQRHFRTETDVDFLLLHNPGIREAPQDVIKLQITDIAPGGGLHYYSKRDVEAFQNTARHFWQQARQTAAFPTEVLAAAGIGMA